MFISSTRMCLRVLYQGYNDAEYLVDLITEADRQGRGGELADHYDG